MADQKVATTKVAGTWPWFLQRLTAVLLIVFLAIHIYVSHFMDVGAETGEEPLITFNEVSLRLNALIYVVVDLGMLTCVLFHGLNGLRTVLFDFDMFANRKKTIDIGLFVLGIGTLVWGVIILLPFINGA